MPKLIPSLITPTQDISLLVRKYIANQSDYEEPPFESPIKRTMEKSGKKVSLSDWRVLFEKSSKGRKREIVGERHYVSDRKFDITQYPCSKNTQRAKDRERDKKFTPQKTSTSFRQSNIESALVQNFYEQKYIQERKIHTAKIKSHYQKTHSQRPMSINIPTRRQLELQKSQDKQEKCKEGGNGRRNRILGNSFWPEKYESVRIKRKYIRRASDIVIEGLEKDDKGERDREGHGIGALRFYGVDM